MAKTLHGASPLALSDVLFVSCANNSCYGPAMLCDLEATRRYSALESSTGDCVASAEC